MKCPKCGNEIRKNDKYCMKCGTPVLGLQEQIKAGKTKKLKIIIPTVSVCATILIIIVIILISSVSSKDNSTYDDQYTEHITQGITTTENKTTESTTEPESTTESEYDCAVVNKLAQGEWYNLEIFVYPGDSYETFRFDKEGSVHVVTGMEYEEEYDVKYEVLNDESVQFVLKDGREIKLELIKNSNVIKAVYTDDDILYHTYWSNEEYNINSHSAFSKSIMGQWDSDFFAKVVSPSNYQLVSIYSMSDDSNGIYGGIMVDHGDFDLNGVGITENLVGFSWDKGWFILEKTNDPDVLNALVITDSQKFESETWTRL